MADKSKRRSLLFRNEQNDNDAKLLNKATYSRRALLSNRLEISNEDFDLNDISSLIISYTELQKEIELIKEQLEEKDRDATMAATLGKSLLNTNDLLRSEIEELKIKLHSSYETTYQLHQKIAELSTTNTQLNTTYMLLSSQMNTAQNENYKLLSDLEELSSKLEDEKKKNKSIPILKEKIIELESSIESLFSFKDELEQLKDKEMKLIETNKKLREENLKQDSEIVQLFQSRERLQEVYSKNLTDLQSLRSEQHKLKTYEQELIELRDEKKILEELPIIQHVNENIQNLHKFLCYGKSFFENLTNSDQIIDESLNIINILLHSISSSSSSSTNHTSTEEEQHHDHTKQSALYLVLAILTQRRNEEIEKRVGFLSAENQHLKEEIDDLIESVAFEKEKNQKNSDYLSKSEGDTLEFAENSQRESELLQKERDNYQSSIDNLMKVQNNLKSSLQIMTRNLEFKDEEVENLKSMIENLMIEKKSIYNEKEQILRKITDFENHSKELNDAVRSLNLEKANLNQIISTLSNENKSLLKSKEIQEGIITSARYEYEQIINEKNDLQLNIHSLNSDISALHFEIENLSSSIELMVKDSKEEANKITHLEDQLIQVNDENRILKDRIAQLELLLNDQSRISASSSSPLFEEKKNIFNESEEENLVTNGRSQFNDLHVLENHHFFDSDEFQKIQTFIYHLLKIDEKQLTITQHIRKFGASILSDLINLIHPGTIDIRALNTHITEINDLIENFNLCLNSAQAIGCKVNHLSSDALLTDNYHLENFIWEIIKLYFLSRINVKRYPEIRLIKEYFLSADNDDNDENNLINAQPEAILIGWINFILKSSSNNDHHHHHDHHDHHRLLIKNFGSDLKDCKIFLHLISSFYKFTNESDSEIECNNRLQSLEFESFNAIFVTDQLNKILPFNFITLQSIEHSNDRMNLLSISMLFENSNLIKNFLFAGKEDDNNDEQSQSINLLPQINHQNNDFNPTLNFSDESETGTREERAFRMWINSLGVGCVNNLKSDVRDGIILLKIFDAISPGIVPWNRVNTNPKGIYQKMENCSLCIDLGRKLRFSLVGIGGKDFYDGNLKFIMALVWQMVKFHLLKICKTKSGEITENDVLKWANSNVKSVKHISNLKESSLSTSLYFLDLISSLSHKSVNKAYIMSAETYDEKRENAKYTISLARKLGCCIFLVWEDIVEVNAKMIFTLLATLMAKFSEN